MPAALAHAPQHRFRRDQAGFSLRYKIFLAAFLLVLVSLGAVCLPLFRYAPRRSPTKPSTDENGRRRLHLLAGRLAQAQTAVKQLADDPNTVAALTQTDHHTVLDYLQAKQQSVLETVDYVMALDAHSCTPTVAPTEALKRGFT
ncbi:MAG: hypothetical protein R3F37_08985 [Candidatus Competibacteraceae bacterium]